jgi:hypothetical protein
MLRWDVETAGPWDAGGPCLTLWAGDSALARVRLCPDGPAVRLENLEDDTARVVAGSVSRPSDHAASVTVPLRELGLTETVLYWRAGSPESHLPAVGKGTLDLRAPPRTLPALLAPPSHPDSLDAGGSPLDVRAVTFGQEGTRLVLAVRTQRPWPADGRLCLLIARTSALAHPARLCVAGTRLRWQGRRVAARFAGGRARVAPSALGLGLGPVWWALETRADRVPDSGAFRTSIRALGTPRCFGAAGRSCRDPRLRTAAYPAPEHAYVWPNSPCRPVRQPAGACAFGVTGSGRRATVALVGDSHAEHWRAALEVVAQVKRWRGISITRPGCPFSVQIPASPALGPADCAAQHAATLAWLRSHPEIHKIFVSGWAEPPSGPQGGTGGYGGGASAYGAMLDQLPRSVRHVYVLRDIPATTLASTACVERRLRRHRAIGTACASPRSAVLTPDPGAAAAATRPRARVIDLTRRFCDATRCYPVVGGVYIHKDDNHMNAVFAATLGPFILRALRDP